MIPGGVFDPSSFEKRIAEIEARTAESDFWNDSTEAEKIMSSLKSIKARFEPWQELVQEIDDLDVLQELAEAENDENLAAEISSLLKNIQKRFDKQNLLELMSGEVDKNACFLTVHAGAGGTEACDWAQMLYRMYLRWAERRGFAVEEIDMLEAEVASNRQRSR
ncbi:hypothetical protein MASR2M78_00270 [Treponema sp.]